MLENKNLERGIAVELSNRLADWVIAEMKLAEEIEITKIPKFSPVIFGPVFGGKLKGRVGK